MSKKKWMSSLLAAALAFTTVFSAGSAVKADETQEAAGKIVVYVAAEGTDAEGHTVDTGKIAAQVDEGSTANVALEQALTSAGVTYEIQKQSWGLFLNTIGDITTPADYSGFWSFSVNGVSSMTGIDSTTVKANDQLSFIYAYGDDQNKTEAVAYSDDVSKNPDSTKTATLLENAKIQQDIVAEATYNSVLDGGETVYGIENPNALYVAFSLIRAGYTAANDYYDKMYTKVKEQLKEIKANGSITVDGEKINLDTVGATAYTKANPETNRAKVVLFVTAMGKDATNIGGCNLIDEMAQKAVYNEAPKDYMLDCTMLLALDCGSYELPSGEAYITRSQLVNSVAASMDSMIETAIKWSSIDMAAMPIQCMYPYTLENNLAAKDADFDQKALQTAYDKGVRFLENTQNNDGTWSGFGGEKNNVWTLAQIMTAMGQLRINPCSEEDGSDFIKNGVTVLDDAAEFFDMENKTLDTDKVPNMPEQLLRGLNAVIRVMEVKTSLYDLSDVTKNPDASEEPSQTPSASPSLTPSASPAAPTQTPSVSPSAPAKTTTPAATTAAPVKKVKKITAAKTKVTVKKGKKTTIKWNVTTAKNVSVKKLVKVTVNKKAVKVVKTSVKKKNATVTKVTTTVKGIKKGSAVVTLKVDGKKSKVKVTVK